MNRLKTGDKIGDYTIRGFLGEGGMGEVYQGEHTRINRLVAIKVLSRYQNNPTFISRFLNEARLQSSLHHPNIATLYDFKEIDSQLFIFMEFADGDVLEDLIKRRFFAVEDALKTFESICDAVAFIHQNGIIHRDIKAQNIKLTSGGRVKLLDFGIAKDSSSQRLTKVGGVIGTPHYLAPEQLAGQEAAVQTDIWSLGVLFYGMLTGVEPFKADTFGELHSRISAASFELPENLNPAISPEISEIVLKCLEKNPSERYQTVDEILGDIRKILRGEKQERSFLIFGRRSKSKGSNSGAGFSDRGSVSGRSNPMIMVAALSAIAVLIVFGIVGISIWAMSSGGDISENSNIIIKPIENSPTPKILTAKESKKLNSQSGVQPSAVRVLVETSEGVAEIYRDSERIGETPYEIEGREGENVDLTLKRNGYLDKQVQIEITARRRVYTFLLQRK